MIHDVRTLIRPRRGDQTFAKATATLVLLASAAVVVGVAGVVIPIATTSGGTT